MISGKFLKDHKALSDRPAYHLQLKDGELRGHFPIMFIDAPLRGDVDIGRIPDGWVHWFGYEEDLPDNWKEINAANSLEPYLHTFS